MKYQMRSANTTAFGIFLPRFVRLVCLSPLTTATEKPSRVRALTTTFENYVNFGWLYWRAQLCYYLLLMPPYCWSALEAETVVGVESPPSY
jgi:hypothetical protein